MKLFHPMRQIVAGIILFIFGFTPSVFSQTGVKIAATPGTADPSAILDVSASNRGLLIPRVNLVGLSDRSSPVASPVVIAIIESSSAPAW